MLLLLSKSMYLTSTSGGEVHTQVTLSGPSLLQQHIDIISLKARWKSAQVLCSSLDSGTESNYGYAWGPEK